MKAVRSGRRPRLRLRLRRDGGRGPTIRTRLALLNTAVLIAGGSALLALNWASAHQVLDLHREVVQPTTVQQPTAPPDTPAAPAETALSVEAAQTAPAARFEDFRDAVLHDLLTRSLLVLLAVAALSLIAGWWVARRSLARIGKVTATARHINDANLHDRLALVGPDDEVKELADTFDAMLNRLERAFADQRRFTAQASHELRTPMTLQRTALEIPLAQGRVPADLEPALRRALAATDRSERLLASLLALARGESGMLDPHPTDLADLARSAVAQIADEAQQMNVHIDTSLHPAPLTGDPVLLGQLVHNLVANAVRHNHPGGSVRITTTRTGARSTIEMSNTGPIVAADDLDDLFLPFRRGTTPHRTGSGLGLAVVRAITHTHHGTLAAHPNPDGGLTLRAELPDQHATD
ncbi:sensor histidine kinase [Kitasatospora sp. NPDC101235]|uniref:sensor histidine kinase n=1 Tax=Kitasatospora sp. NPDC101235 TaxID=3364101 RepID=UPI003819771C